MKLKYYLRGLGIGIICTTLVLTIEFRVQQNTISNEEIISRAEQLGMVMPEEGEEGIDKGEDANEDKETKDQEETQDRNTETESSESDQGTEEDASQKKEITGEKEKPKEDAEKSDNTGEKVSKPEEKKKTSEKKVDFEIRSGEFSDVVSQNLFQQGIVDNAEAFNDFIVSNQYDSMLQPGVYTLPKGGSYEEIINILLGR